MTAALRPGRAWRVVRRAAQVLALLTIVGAPLLGGWQRLDHSELATWTSTGWDLPGDVRARLPLGDRPAQAYDGLVLHGGGTAVEYLSVPALDPVPGTVALIRGGLTLRFGLALLLPLLLAAVAGRVFCGWLCPFGVLSRGVQAGLDRLPWRPRHWQLPRRRPLRWIVLGTTVALSIVGVHALMFLFLPHLLVQQSVYSAWLLGGGGAILGVLLGLIAAGIVFGPTTYCATVCPTGAALGLVGHYKRVRLTIADTEACGAHCSLCDRACWLGLAPASGDPGPDCDSCGRCAAVCPHDNLEVGLGVPHRRRLPVIAAALLAVLVSSTPARAEVRAPTKPELLLNAELVRDDVIVAITAIDYEGVKLDLDWEVAETGVELSIFMARRARQAPDALGLAPSVDVYRGPLSVALETSGQVRTVVFDAPNSPVSTPRRAIYRSRVQQLRLGPGDTVTVAPVPGWLAEPVEVAVPPRGVAPGMRDTLIAFIGASLAFLGLLSLALAIPDSRARAHH